MLYFRLQRPCPPNISDCFHNISSHEIFTFIVFLSQIQHPNIPHWPFLGSVITIITVLTKRTHKHREKHKSRTAVLFFYILLIGVIVRGVVVFARHTSTGGVLLSTYPQCDKRDARKKSLKMVTGCAFWWGVWFLACYMVRDWTRKPCSCTQTVARNIRTSGGLFM